MSVKLIASDLDGTLLTSDKKISECTRRVLQKAIEQGICFVPATGRSLTAIPGEILDFPGVEYIITGNGAAIYRKEQRKGARSSAQPADQYSLICRHALTPASVESVFSLPLPACVAAELYISGIAYAEPEYIRNPAVFGTTGPGIAYIQSTRHPVDNLREFALDNRNCIDGMSLICADDDLRRDLRRLLLDTVPDIFLTAAVSHLIEIGHVEGGKANALAWLLHLLGIDPSETIACGNADNDAGMLALVKYGIAMGNATPACLQAAYYVSESNDEDGAARGIEKILTRPD